jgi:hypothetical protein
MIINFIKKSVKASKAVVSYALMCVFLLLNLSACSVDVMNLYYPDRSLDSLRDAWNDEAERTEVLESIEELVIGLPKQNVIDLLGTPLSQTAGAGVFHDYGRGLMYLITTERQLGFRRYVFLVILLDEDLIAKEVRINRS